VTTVGIVEQARLAINARDLIRQVGRRSVFSQETLEAMSPSRDSPVLVIDFLLNGHLSPHIPIQALFACGAFVGNPPQSIKRIEQGVYEKLMALTRVSFE
jgi:hypothetical protein